MTFRSPTQWPAILLARARSASWPRRIFATLVFVFAALAASWVLGLPAAATIEDAIPSTGWPVETGDEVTLISPAPGEVLRFRGPQGKGVSVVAETAQLLPATLQELAAHEIALGPQPAPLQWVTHNGGASAATVKVGFQPAGPHPALIVRFAGQGAAAALTFQGQDARLVVYMAGAAVDEPSPDVEINDGPQAFVIGGSGAFPLQAGFEPGQAVTLQFAQAAVGGATFSWGPDKALGLPFAALRVQRPGEGDRLYACGAPKFAISWVERDISRLACRSNLELRGLNLIADGSSVHVTGIGFLKQKDETTVQVWKARSPPVSALLSALWSGLAAWVIAAVLGPSDKAAGKTPKTAPARGGAKARNGRGRRRA